LNRILLRTAFDWAFIQTSNAKLEEAECREELIGVLGRGELTLAMTKRVLTLVSHRVEASRPAGYVGIEGLLQLLGGAMTLAKQNLLPQGFDAAKEFMISRLNHLKVLYTTPVSGSVRDSASTRSCLVYRRNQHFSVLRTTFASTFGSDVNDRFLLGDIVKHWLTRLVEGTHIDLETVGRPYNGVPPG